MRCGAAPCALAAAVALGALAGCGRARPAKALPDETSLPPEVPATSARPDARPSIEHWLAFEAAPRACGDVGSARARGALLSWGPDPDPFEARAPRDVWIVEEAPALVCRRTVTLGRDRPLPAGLWIDPASLRAPTR